MVAIAPMIAATMVSERPIQDDLLCRASCRECRPGFPRGSAGGVGGGYWFTLRGAQMRGAGENLQASSRLPRSRGLSQLLQAFEIRVLVRCLAGALRFPELLGEH